MREVVVDNLSFAQCRDLKGWFWKAESSQESPPLSSFHWQFYWQFSFHLSPGVDSLFELLPGVFPAEV